MKSSIMRSAALAAAGIMAGSMALGTAPAASAATWDHILHTDDEEPGGLIRFKETGDYVEVCDIEADGWAARGFVNDGDLSYVLIAGGNGNCSIVSAATPGRNLHEDRRFVDFRICLVKDGESPQFCDAAFWPNNYTGDVRSARAPGPA